MQTQKLREKIAPKLPLPKRMYFSNNGNNKNQTGDRKLSEEIQTQKLRAQKCGQCPELPLQKRMYLSNNSNNKNQTGDR